MEYAGRIRTVNKYPENAAQKPLKFCLIVLMAAWFVMGVSSCLNPSAQQPILRPIPEQNISDLQEIKIEVLLITTDSASVPGVRVTAETDNSTSSDVTNSEGKASLSVLVDEGKGIDFRFSSESMDWTERMLNVPRGISSAKIAFRVDKLGRATIAAIEY
jgi:hypothetical protein